MANLTDEMRRGFAALDEKIDRVGAETQAMIRFSHADLDRRFRTLEEKENNLEERVDGLQERVGRLERSTQ
jgi:hypothetical protein